MTKPMIQALALRQIFAMGVSKSKMGSQAWNDPASSDNNPQETEVICAGKSLKYAVEKLKWSGYTDRYPQNNVKPSGTKNNIISMRSLAWKRKNRGAMCTKRLSATTKR